MTPNKFSRFTQQCMGFAAQSLLIIIAIATV
jgi:hypothetical protein